MINECLTRLVSPIAGLRARVDVDEGSGDLLVRAELRHQLGLRDVQAVRPAVPEVQDGQVRARHVVPGGGRQGNAAGFLYYLEVNGRFQFAIMARLTCQTCYYI